MQVINNLSLREKMILIFASLSLLALMSHAFIWQPLVDDSITYQEQLEQEKEDLVWIQENIGQLKNTNVKAKAIKGSFISWLDLKIKKSPLKKSLKRIKPRDSEQVKVWMEDVNAQQLMQFLGEIKQYTINIEEIKIIALDEQGFVNVTIILQSQT